MGGALKPLVAAQYGQQAVGGVVAYAVDGLQAFFLLSVLGVLSEEVLDEFLNEFDLCGQMVDGGLQVYGEVVGGGLLFGLFGGFLSFEAAEILGQLFESGLFGCGLSPRFGANGFAVLCN